MAGVRAEGERQEEGYRWTETRDARATCEFDDDSESLATTRASHFSAHLLLVHLQRCHEDLLTKVSPEASGSASCRLWGTQDAGPAVSWVGHGAGAEDQLVQDILEMYKVRCEQNADRMRVESKVEGGGRQTVTARLLAWPHPPSRRMVMYTVLQTKRMMAPMATQTRMTSM